MFFATASGCGGSGGERLVVYCTHDAAFSQQILDAFEKKTGIKTVPVFDSEATKSLGLSERLIREKDAPRCDVFWNNELLGTLDLADRGMLEPYKGTGWQRIPAEWKDDDGRWTGFGARLRLVIVNVPKFREAHGAEAQSPLDAVVARVLNGDLSDAAIAKPLYGTTLTHYALLWQELGPAGLKAWHADCRKRGLREVNGNGAVKDLVAEGACAFGFTDADDYFEATDDGKAVDMAPVRVGGKVICIPNTVAVIKGTKRLDAAKKLADYLASEEAELAMANSKSRQIPLGPVDETKLSEDVRRVKALAAPAYPLKTLGKARAECLAWLKGEYLK